jgi:hypothetical protein
MVEASTLPNDSALPPATETEIFRC